MYGGLAGGVLAFGLGYTWYQMSGLSTAVNTVKQAKNYFDTGAKKLKDVAPEPNAALDWLRQQTSFYASFVPGGKSFIDSAFKDIDIVREKHGDEVDQIVKEAYNEIKEVASKDLSVSTANEAWQILQKHMKRITDLASDSAHEILNNHPQLQSKIGANVDQLRSLGNSLGPEANKMVQDTWSQLSEIVTKGGIGIATVTQIKQLIQDKTEQIKKLGDKAWNKGMEEAKPYLDKNPKIKQMIDDNKSALMSGNVSDLWTKLKSGKVDDLEKYVKQAADKAKEKSKDLGGDMSSSLMSMFGSSAMGGQVMSQFQNLQEIVQKTDTKDMEKLLQETITDIKELLEKKIEKGKDLVGGNNNDKGSDNNKEKKSKKNDDN